MRWICLGEHEGYSAEDIAKTEQELKQKQATERTKTKAAEAKELEAQKQAAQQSAKKTSTQALVEALTQPSEAMEQIDKLKTKLKADQANNNRNAVFKDYEQLLSSYNSNLVLDQQHLNQVTWREISPEAQQQCGAFAEFIKEGLLYPDKIFALKDWLKKQVTIKDITIDERINLFTMLQDIQTVLGEYEIQTARRGTYYSRYDALNYSFSLTKALQEKMQSASSAERNQLQTEVNTEITYLKRVLPYNIEADIQGFNDQIKNKKVADATTNATNILSMYEMLIALSDPQFELEPQALNNVSWSGLGSDGQQYCYDLARFIQDVKEKFIRNQEIVPKIAAFIDWG